MKKLLVYIKGRIAILGLLLFTAISSVVMSCNSNSEIGNGLTGDEVTIVVDSTFTLTGSSVRSEAVLSRTVIQIMGVIDGPEFGYMKSDVVTQFMPANSIDTAGVTWQDVDSLKLVMYVNSGSFVGDSLALMGMEVYPLTRQLSVPIYSNFDPEGYYDSSNPLGSLVYDLLKSSEPDSLKGLVYHTLRVKLPQSLGQDFFREYVNNPSTYSSPTNFAKFFPGLYIKNTYGSGRITRIGNTVMEMYYHRNTTTEAGKDTTIYKVGTYFAVTPEIITNNDISLDMSKSVTDAADAGEVLIVAPTGLNAQLNFPAPDIIRAFNTGTQNGLGVVNALTFTVPVETIANKYDISVPDNVLLVLKSEYEDFFLNNKLTDEVTSFRATLSTLADGTKAYVFSDMRQYIVELMAKESITPDDYTFMLVPVNVSAESSNDYYGNSSETITGIIPYVSEPRMARIAVEKAKIKFVYSLRTTD